MLCSKVSTSLTGARVPTLPKRVQSTRVQKSGAVCVAASPVPADGVDSFDSIVDGLVSGLRTGAGLVKSAVPIVQSAITEATPVVKNAYDKVEPVFESGVKVGLQALGEAAKVAGPAAGDAANQISGLLSSSGLDASSPVVKTTVEVANEASLLAGSSYQFLASQTPVILAEYAAAAAALYFLAPPLLGAFSGLFRGYREDLTPAQALDMLLTEGDSCVLVDLRSAREKEQAGIPDVPGSASSRVIELEFATTEDRKVRGLLRDAAAVEVKITALQIAALRRVSRGSKVILMDGAGSVAKSVARELGLGKGFTNVFVLKGGYRSWTQSKLETRVSRTVSSPTVVMDSATVIKRAGTITKSTGGMRALPGSR